ncbi:acyltransferase [Bosea sp. SSUT16]|jgi:peptidoglycan/LPS O-acetylase OafA/YrhL|uniref:Acyltransferase n=1 Tax=Bosea spartocytisi TaxID=2773451 RepID=A0A927ECL1_9HYPH|nr:acyltransferase [Bosea spartocytisi]MBD3848796.1 acyltransferase [Bosea spartocytisi]MCT4471360.1 acyltransferase [Bosea spartocytisi]
MSQPNHLQPGLRLETLDGLRLLAALSVALFHFGFCGLAIGFTQMSLPAGESVLKYGYLGVPLFFVISGFVIAYSAEGRTPLQFAIARFARIYPTFLLCMTLTFLVVLALGAPFLQASAAQWAANLVIKPELLGYQAMDGSYWSIFYEVIFYGWVLLLMALGAFRRDRYPLIVLVWLLVSVLDRAFLSSKILRYLLLTDQSAFFCAGLLLYAAFRDGHARRNLALLTLTTAVAIYQALELTQWYRANYHAAYDDFAVAASCVAIVAIVAAAIRFPRLPLPSGVTLAIGGLTYPFYLLHQHIGYVAFNRLGDALSPAALVAAVTLVLLVLSCLIWRFVERPAQSWTKSTLTGLAAAGALLPANGARPRAGIAN